MPRNLPGVTAQDPEEDDDDLDRFEGDDEEFDTEEEDEFEGEDDDEADDEEEELDAKTAAIVAKREAAILAKTREGLRAQGFDLADDFTPTVRDRTKASGFLGAPAALPPVQAAPPAPKEEEKDDPMPDPDIDGQPAFQAWMARQTAKAVKQALEPVVQKLNQSEARVLQRDARDATRTAARLLQAEGFGDAARHPEFAQVFQSFLGRLDPEQWNDEDNLLRLSLMCLPDLKGATNPQADRTKVRNRARSDANRSFLNQANPSRATGSAPRQPTKADPIDEAVAKRMGMSVEEYVALKDPSGAAYERFKAKKAGKAGKR